MCPVSLLRDFKLQPQQVERGRRHVQTWYGCLDDGTAQVTLTGEDVIGRDFAHLVLDTQPGRGVSLRIEIQDQNLLPDGPQAQFRG